MFIKPNILIIRNFNQTYEATKQPLYEPIITYIHRIILSYKRTYYLGL